MTRVEQYKINCECVYRWQDAMQEYMNNFDKLVKHKLRTCQAIVYETDNFYILQSFETLVAIIDKRDNVTIDMLRHVYHFTQRSAGQIAKFVHDYTPYPWNSPRYTWRELK